MPLTGSTPATAVPMLERRNGTVVCCWFSEADGICLAVGIISLHMDVGAWNVWKGRLTGVVTADMFGGAGRLDSTWL